MSLLMIIFLRSSSKLTHWWTYSGLCRIWDSHGSDYEEFCLLDIMPCSALKTNQLFRGISPLSGGLKNKLSKKPE
jgi:hypothetical protein